MDMKTTIQNGFRRCGLYPFDKDAVDYTKCVQNVIEYTQTCFLLFRNMKLQSQKRSYDSLNLPYKGIDFQQEELNKMKISKVPEDLSFNNALSSTSNETQLNDIELRHYEQIKRQIGI